MIENLTLGGGGIFGYSYIGVIQFLEEKNLLKDIKNFLGTSVGSVICLLLTIGYTLEELKALVFNLDIINGLDIKNNNILEIIDNYGFDNGYKLIKIIKIFIKKKNNDPNITFLEHFKKYNKKLIISGVNINTNKNIFFDYQSYPNMSIFQAIRISCSIPLIFQPYYFENDYYIDGCVIDSCPINYFGDEKNTIGFILTTQNCLSKEYRNEFNNFQEYLRTILYLPIKYFNKRIFNKKNTIQIIFNNEYKNYSLDFFINKEKIKDLIKIGYKICLKNEQMF